MRWLLVLASTVVGGLSDADVILVNDTGLPIARIEIDARKLESLPDGQLTNKILISVTPSRHHLKLVFRGGADIDWPHFDFRGVHEVFFQRVQNKIEARVE